MTALISRILRRKSPAAIVPVIVYTRKDCCCCHKAIDILNRYQRKDGLEISLVDVDSDPALVESYGLMVPVVAIDGKVRFKGTVNPVLLERILANRDA